MIDVKKLSVNFLILATLISLLVLSFSTSLPFLGGPKNAPQAYTNPSVSKNAFLARSEGLPLALRENLSDGNANLTNFTAQNLAQVVLALNPLGPTTDQDGNTGYNVPASKILVPYLTMQLLDNNTFRVSDLLTSPQDEVFPTVPGDTATNQAYTDQFHSILKSTISSPSFISEVENTNVGDPLVASMASTYSQAIDQLKGMEVPQPFADFHQNFLVYLEDQKNVFSALSLNNVDPVKSLLVLGNTDELGNKVTVDASKMLNSYNKLDLASLLSRSNGSPIFNAVSTAFSGIAENFTIPSAKAFSFGGSSPADNCTQGQSQLGGLLGGLLNSFTKVPVVDDATEQNTASIAALEMIACNARVMAQTSKQKMVDLLDSDVQDYVQGNHSQAGKGTPRIIGNFGQYAGQAGDQAALNSYEQALPDICPQFVNAVQSTTFDPNSLTGSNVQTPNGADVSNDTIVDDAGQNIGGLGFGSGGVNGVGTGCSIVNNVDPVAFANDFNADPNDPIGDLLSLVTDPSNNLYGTIGAVHDLTTQTAGTAAAGAQAESIANQGFTADTKCLNSYTDSSGKTICTDQKVVTPGSVTASRTNDAVNLQNDAVVNAQDPVEMDGEVADGFTTQLISKAPQGLANIQLTADNSIANLCQNFNISGGGTTVTIANPLLATCNSFVSKIVADLNKYLNMLQQIEQIIKLFF